MQRVIALATVCLLAPAVVSAQAVVNPTVAQLAAALDIPAADVVSVEVVASPDIATRRVVADWGIKIAPRAGGNMVALSTGIAADQRDPGFTHRQGGTRWNVFAPDAPPQPPDGCAPTQDIYDLTEIRVVLRAPLNATGFSFDYNYLSTEYPDWLCSQFADAFLALVDSAAFTGNIAFDAEGRYATTNGAFFAAPLTLSKSLLAGTGLQNGGGATMWIPARAPVVGGDTVTLRFVIYDGGDDAYDSHVLLDNFTWTLADPASTSLTVWTGPDR
jgi:hypothetical protein